MKKPFPFHSAWSREMKITLAEAEARRERRKADLERRTVYHAPLPWLGKPIAVGVINIPISEPQSFTQENTKMTVQRLDPIFGVPVSVHGKLFSSRPGSEADDESANADDDGTGSTSLGVAHDLIGCVLAGKDNTSECNHSGVDHIATAREVLDRYARDEGARQKRREAVGQPTVVGVRFA